MLFTIAFLLTSIIKPVESSCSRGCELALGSFFVQEGMDLSFISTLTSITLPDILSYNPQILNQDAIIIQEDTRLNIPFSCDCLYEFLGHSFTYIAGKGDTYEYVAEIFSNLTTAGWLKEFNSYLENNISERFASFDVMVNCSCGDAEIDERYGLFVTYPLRIGESLESIAAANNLSAELIKAYNPAANFSAGSGLVYFPVRDKDGSYRPLNTSTKARLSIGDINVF